MTQIKLRRDTSANFTSKNPVLGIGEPAYETDTKKLKIGDGTTAYTQLEYFSTGGGGSANISATLPLKIVNGVISLDVDGQTIQIVDGKLHANLDELGHEVNSLVGVVASVQDDLFKKQDGLVSASPIEIKKSTGLTVVETPMSGNDFVMDRISTTSYCLFPEDYLEIGNEYQIKFTTPSSWPSGYSSIVDFYDPLGPQYDYETGNISVWTNRNGAGFEPVIPNPTLNTTYYIRMSMVTSTRIKTCYSTDGKTFTEWKFTDINPELPWSAQRHHIGVAYDPRTGEALRAWTGTIDLKECYVIADDIKYYMFPNAKKGAIGINLGSGLTVTDGKLTANSSAPENMVTTDTQQTITGLKTFTRNLYVGSDTYLGDKYLYLKNLSIGASDTSDINIFTYQNLSLVGNNLFYRQPGTSGGSRILHENNLGNYVDGTTITYSNNKLSAVGGGSSAPTNMVTTDTNQIITGPKTFKGEITASHPFVFDCREGNARFDVIYKEKGTGTVNTAPVIDFSLDKFTNNIRFGINGVTLQIVGNVKNGNNKKFLTQGNVTGIDNVTVTETTDGIQVAGLSNSAIAGLSGMSSNITLHTNVVSGTEYTTTEAGFWIAQGETTGVGYITIDMKDQQGNWISIAGINSFSQGVYLIATSPLIAAGETIRMRHGNISTVYLHFAKQKGGVQ